MKRMPCFALSCLCFILCIDLYLYSRFISISNSLIIPITCIILIVVTKKEYKSNVFSKISTILCVITIVLWIFFPIIFFLVAMAGFSINHFTF